MQFVFFWIILTHFETTTKAPARLTVIQQNNIIALKVIRLIWGLIMREVLINEYSTVAGSSWTDNEESFSVQDGVITALGGIVAIVVIGSLVATVGACIYQYAHG